MKRKHGGTVYATISVIRDFEDVEVEVSGYYEPEQNGGWDDPSWSAYVTLNRQRLMASRSPLTKDEIDHAEEVMLEKGAWTRLKARHFYLLLFGIGFG